MILRILLLIYYCAINLIAFICYGVDKRLAIAGKYRISEKNLLLLAAFGGGLGAFCGMRVFHHKTRKTKFRLLVPLCLIAHLLLAGFILYHTM